MVLSFATTPSQKEAQAQADPEKTRIAADKRFKKELYHYLRWALSGGNPGPGIPETMAILGRAESIKRLDEAKALTGQAVAASAATEVKGNGKEDTDDRAWMGSLAPRS